MSELIDTTTYPKAYVHLIMVNGLGQDEGYLMIQTRYPLAFDSSATPFSKLLRSSKPLCIQTRNSAPSNF